MNLVEGLSREIERVTELKQRYREIGPAGAIALMLMDQATERAHAAAASGDIVEMMQAYKYLEGFTS